MKHPLRLVLICCAGLFLAGCATTRTGATETKPRPETALGDKPLSARDHFYMRESDEKEQRARGTP